MKRDWPRARQPFLRCEQQGRLGLGVRSRLDFFQVQSKRPSGVGPGRLLNRAYYGA
jgi:hypothetical protein